MANQHIDRRQMTPDEVDERRYFVMEQRVKALSFDAIAKLVEQQFGYRVSVSQCADDFRQIMRRRSAELHEDTDAMRATMLAQLDKILTPALEIAERGDLDAMETVIKIMQRKSRLLGTDAPTRTETEDKTRGQLTAVQILDRIAAIKARVEQRALPSKEQSSVQIEQDVTNAVLVEEVPRKDAPSDNNAESPTKVHAKEQSSVLSFPGVHQPEQSEQSEG